MNAVNAKCSNILNAGHVRQNITACIDGPRVSAAMVSRSDIAAPISSQTRNSKCTSRKLALVVHPPDRYKVYEWTFYAGWPPGDTLVPTGLGQA